MSTGSRLCTFFSVVSVLLFVLGLRSAAAQEPPAPLEGVALSRFEPSERGSRFFLADSLELRAGSPGVPKARFSVGMPATFAYRATTFGSRREGERSTLSETAFFVHPGASVVLSPGARFGLDVPIAITQSGDNTNLAGKFYGAPQGPRLGDVRGSFDLRIFGPASRDSDGIALAGGVSAWFPTGSVLDFAGDEGTRFGVRVVSAARYGWFLASLRAGYMYRREGLLGGSFVAPEVNTVLGAAWANDVWTIGPELAASTVIEAAFAKRTTPVEALLGVHRSYGAFRFGLGVGTLLAKGMGAARARGVISIEWIPSLATPEDRDRDGVPDDEDACPDTFGWIETKGCPLTPEASPSSPAPLPLPSPSSPSPSPSPPTPEEPPTPSPQPSDPPPSG
jgi:OmpA-OmpF porin, OOP family